jgi:O-antigen ligase
VPSIPTITAPTWPTAARRVAEPVRVAGFVLGVLALEAVLAHGVVGPQISKLVFLFLGAFIVAFVFRFPMASALVVVGLTDFVFYPTYFAHQVGPVSVRPHELALACLVAVAILRPQRRTWGGTAGVALAVFYAMVAISAIIAVSGGATSITEAFNWARPLSLLSLFYVVVRLFPEPEQRRFLLMGAAVIAAVTGILALMISLGAGFGQALQAAGSQTIKAENGLQSIDRVRLPGLSAGYALFWYVAVQIAARPGARRLGWGLLLTGILIDIVVSFNRNMWLGIALGLALMVIVGGVRVRSRLTIATAVAMGAVALFVAFGASTSNSTVVEPIIKRGATIFNPGKTSKENSLQARFHETSEAWKTAQHHLLVGVGAGAPFGVLDQQAVTSGETIVSVELVPQLFLHNQYLYLVLIAGVPGLVAFLVFLIAPLSGALKRRPRDPAIAACGIGIALIMISAIVAIYFTVEDMTAMLGLLTGVIVADLEGRAAAGEDSGLLA